MPIKSGVGTGVISVLAADTTILDTTDRVLITASSCHNTNAAGVTVTFYISPNLTSASGKVVDKVVLATNETKDVSGIIAEGYVAAENIIAVGTLTGVNCTTTFVQYSGDDV